MTGHLLVEREKKSRENSQKLESFFFICGLRSDQNKELPLSLSLVMFLMMIICERNRDEKNQLGHNEKRQKGSKRMKEKKMVQVKECSRQ